MVKYGVAFTMRSPGFDVAFCKVAGRLFSLDHILIENPCQASISTDNLAEITCIELERVIKRSRATSTPRGCHESKQGHPVSCRVHSGSFEMLRPLGTRQ